MVGALHRQIIVRWRTTSFACFQKNEKENGCTRQKILETKRKKVQASKNKRKKLGNSEHVISFAKGEWQKKKSSLWFAVAPL